MLSSLPGPVGRERRRIDEHAVGTVDAVAAVEHGLLLRSLAPHVKVAPAPVGRRPRHRRTHVTDRQQIAYASPQRIASGDAREPRPRRGVLGFVPGAHLGRIAVLEPAIRIGHGDAMKHLDEYRDAETARRHRATACRDGLLSKKRANT